jgi:Ras GTPase-activating-like protein IQGAP2/3
MISQIEEETGSLPENLPRGVPPEAAAANPDVQAIIAPRLTMLMEIANSFLVTIIDSLEDVPYGIRWICKQIRSLTRVRSSVSSFILLFFLSENGRENTQRQPT